MGDNARTPGEALLAAVIEGDWDGLDAKLRELTDVEITELRGDLHRLDQAARKEQWRRVGSHPVRATG